MGAVGAAEGVGRLAFQFGFYGLEISFWHDHVRVEYYEIFALRALRAVVAALPRAAVRLGVVVQVELAGVFCAHVLARRGAAVFYDYNLKVFDGLGCEAFQKFVDFVGAVVHGNDE